MRRSSLFCGLSLSMLASMSGTDLGAQVLFSDGFEHGLSGWETYGTLAPLLVDSGDDAHGQVLVLRPNGDTHVLIRGSESWRGVRLEGSVLFPENVNNYLGIVYNLVRRGDRMDFGDIYIKGNGSYLQVNPHRDYNVGRTLYPERSVQLEGEDAIRIAEWQRFRVEVVGAECHFYVGDMRVPKLTFSDLELSSGAFGLQPRSVGGEVWVDDVVATSIPSFSYDGPPVPAIAYDPSPLLRSWDVLGPLDRDRDEAARDPAAVIGWRPFATDARGAVVTGRVVDFHGPGNVAYFRTTLRSERAGPAVLHFSTIDDLAVWVNGRFHWFLDRDRRAWPDFLSNPDHEGQRIPIDLKAGDNDLVIRVHGGVYATGGFFVRFEGPEG